MQIAMPVQPEPWTQISPPWRDPNWPLHATPVKTKIVPEDLKRLWASLEKGTNTGDVKGKGAEAEAGAGDGDGDGGETRPNGSAGADIGREWIATPSHTECEVDCSAEVLAWAESGMKSPATGAATGDANARPGLLSAWHV